jgi:hypothetical protein
MSSFDIRREALADVIDKLVVLEAVLFDEERRACGDLDVRSYAGLLGAAALETDSWDEVLAHIDDPVLRYNGQAIAANWPIARKMALHNEVPGLMFQDCQGRIPHQATLAEPVEETDVHRDVTLIRRGMDSFGFDLQVVFPQPMLEIGLHPNPEIAAQLVLAYNRWFVKDLLPKDSRMRSLLALPFEDPSACLKTISEHADNPSVLGFMITSQRHTGVHQNEHLPIYRELEERGLPLAFHAGPTQPTR